MRYMILIAALLTANAAMADRQTRKEATGNDKVIWGSVSLCTIPQLAAPQEQQFPITETSISFGYRVCREYANYDVDVSGKFWNTKDSNPGPKTLTYEVEAMGKPVIVPIQSTQNPDKTYSVDVQQWTVANLALIEQCHAEAERLASQAVHLESSKCQPQP